MAWDAFGIKNGLLLRSDMHILFDKGYMTVRDDRRVEVSQRIREKNTEFVRRLILGEMISADTLVNRLNKTVADKKLPDRGVKWVKRIVGEL